MESIKDALAQQHDQLESMENALRLQLANIPADNTDIGGAIFDKIAMISALRAGVNAGVPIAMAAIEASVSGLLSQVSTQPNKKDQNTAIAAILAGQAALEALQNNLNDIQGSLLGEAFQSQLSNVLTQAGKTEELEALNAQTDRLRDIAAQLEGEDLTDKERRKLLEEQYNLLVTYTGDLDDLLNDPAVRNIDGAAELIETVKQAKADLKEAGLEHEKIKEQLTDRAAYHADALSQDGEMDMGAVVKNIQTESRELTVAEVDNGDSFTPSQSATQHEKSDMGISF